MRLPSGEITGDESAGIVAISGMVRAVASRRDTNMGAYCKCHSERSEEAVWAGGTKLQFCATHPHRSLATLGMTSARAPTAREWRDVSDSTTLPSLSPPPPLLPRPES